MPQDFFNQDIVGQFKNEELVKKARKAFVKTPKFKKNPAQDNSLSVAKQKFGDPVQESAVKIANKANVDPRFTKTTAKQNTPRTIESAMKEYDLHRYGFATNGDPQYNDSDRKYFKEALDVHIYGGKGNNGEVIPPSKDGSIPPGKWAQMLDSLKSRTGNDVLSLGRELKSNPELNLQDETATAIADTFRGATKLPAQMLSAPIENITNEAMPDGSVKNFIQGVNPLLSQAITGPVGVASGFADMFGSVTSGEASDQIKGIIDTSKSILDTKADPGTRIAGTVNLALMTWGLIHGVKTLTGNSRVPKLDISDPVQAKQVLDGIERQYGQPIKDAVVEIAKAHPEELKQAFDTHKFTEDLKAQEGPIEFGNPPKFTVRAKALGQERPTATNPETTLEPTVETQPTISQTAQKETIPNEKTVQVSEGEQGTRKLGDETQGNIGRGERPGNATEVPPTDEANLQEDVSKSTGIANQVQEREALAGIINEVDKTTGKSKKHWQEAGKAEVDNGADYESLADRIAKGEEELTGLKVGILTEGKRILLNHVNSLKAELDANPTPETRAQYEAAQSRLDNYLQNVQSGKGRWSDVGRALQAGTNLDTGNFAEVIREAKRKPYYDPKKDADIQKLTSEVAKRDAEIERLKANPNEYDAKNEVSKVSNRRYNKNQIRSNIEQNRTRLKELVGSGGVGGPRTRGAVTKITAEDIKLSVDQARLIKEIALDHVRLGLANLEDVVIAVQKLLKEDGIDIDRQAVVDAIATKEESKPRSSQQKTIDEIRAEAKRQSTEATDRKTRRAAQEVYDKAERATKAEADRLYRQWWNNEAAILDAKEQLSTGKFVRKPKAQRTVTDEIADLEAQRKIWDSRVKAKLREMDTPKWKRILRGGANTVRGVTLGSDLGVVTRQGLFAISRPKAFAKGISNASKNMFSEENLAKWVTETEEKRYSDGKSALRARKEAGLSTTDALNSHEELIIGPLAQKLFGRKLGGSLERFQTTFINTVRNELFDAAYEKGLTPEELKTRARFINNVTGRGNLKSAPSDLANIIMTSPRYEASRWGTIGEYLRNPVEALGNKGARQNLQDLAVTSATVYALLQASQLAGYKLNFDPKSSDFLKMRKGNEVWDVTAGLAPRIRDVLRIALTMRDVATTGKMDFGTDIIKSAGKTVTRTISPAIKAPITEGLHSAQTRNGIAKPKDIFSGFSDDGEIHGWMAFAPLIVQSFWQSLTTEKKSLPESLGVATKEFVGTGINFYPENKAKRKSSKFSPSFKRKRS